MKDSSKANVLAFFQAYLEYSNDTTANPCGFTQTCGLCNNFSYSSFNRNMSSYDLFTKLIKDEYPDNPVTPFDAHKQYWEEKNSADFHLNPLRLAFCRKMIDQLSEA